MANILLVEDDLATEHRLTWALAEAGHTVIVMRSTDGVEAAVRSHRPHILIFNSEMAIGEKAAIIERIRASADAPRVIDLHTHDERRRGEIIADGYLHKPFSADDLLAAVDALVEEPSRAESDGRTHAGRSDEEEAGR